jgi:hypothetical protein
LSDLHGGLEATDDERKEAACALADDLHKCIQEGAQLMAQEQTKNYRHLGEVPFIFLFKLLRFYDPALAHDFATLSKVLPTSRGEDTLVDRFVRGKALPVLFDHCVAVDGALPVDESVVELMFSAEKTIHWKNESREQTSHELQFQQNTVALLRSERALMSTTSKNKGNHSTLAQVHKAGEDARICREVHTGPDVESGWTEDISWESQRLRY